MIKKYSFFAFASITLLCLFFASCRSAKYLEEGQALVVDVDMEGVPPRLQEQAHAYVSNELKPNSRLNLTIYNMFNTKNGAYKKLGLRNVGEPPNILDSSFVDFSARQINGYLLTRGYLHASVTPEVEIRNKKAKIVFRADTGAFYTLGDISYIITDSAIANIYQRDVRPISKVKSGKQFNSADLLEEREDVYLALKEHGYYDYLRQYMRVGVDTNAYMNQADLHFEVLNPNESSNHTVYEIDSVHVLVQKPEQYTGKRNPKRYVDSLLGISFEDETGRFRLKPLARYMYVRSGNKYNIREENNSYDRLYEMNGFRNVKINYEKVDSNKLDVYYTLIPRPVMANQLEGEFAFSSGMSGFNVGNTFSHRNVFGGAEHLEVKLRYGVLFDPRLPGNLQNKIFNTDFQFGVNLIFPRLMLPFGHPGSSGKYGLPRTTLSSNLQLFQQDGTYANRYFTNSINYLWHTSENTQHSLTPISLEYRVGRLNAAFAQELEEEGYLLYVRSNNREYFGLGAQYAFTYNARKLLRLEDFNYFRGSVDMSGNVLGLASGLFNLQKNTDGQRLVFGVPYLQYAKAELDYRWYKYLGGNRQFVFRFNSGVAVPYGNNSSLLIFEKSFFSGGMNGIRAWQARTLGPGSYNREVLPNENLRRNLRNLDQLGEFKLETNAEYRFRLLNRFLGAKLNGATFLDAGNIWRLQKNELNPGGEFQADKFLAQIAIGTGFGLRMDMDYFVLRLDAGLKVKDPQFSGSDQWVIKELFNSREFKRMYNATHRPDRYSFFQYNFSVGLPF